MIQKILEKVRGGWIFLGLVLFLYFVALALNFELGKIALQKSLEIGKGLVFPLILVFAAMFAFNVFLDPQKASYFIGRKSGIKGWVIAVIGGILSSGPVYLWYPLLSDLRSSGLKNSLIAVFLYNRAIKIPLLPVMVAYFSWTFVIILSVYMVAFSILNGLAVGFFTNKN
jgi:uncharacterized membrane protein YraQ (UPF0718 family)